MNVFAQCQRMRGALIESSSYRPAKRLDYALPALLMAIMALVAAMTVTAWTAGVLEDTPMLFLLPAGWGIATGLMVWCIVDYRTKGVRVLTYTQWGKDIGRWVLYALGLTIATLAFDVAVIPQFDGLAAMRLPAHLALQMILLTLLVVSEAYRRSTRAQRAQNAAGKKGKKGKKR